MQGEIQVADAAEIEEMVDWAAAEGWNPGIGDAAAYRATDPEGFLVSRDERGLSACISVVAYDDAFGFLGFYMVRPDRRGQGLGKRIWDAGIARLGERCIGLDGVVAQQDNYRRSGFVYAHRNRRYAGVPASRPAAALPEGCAILPVGPDLVPAVIAYDRACFPAERTSFLVAWLASPRNALALVEGDALRGYGVIRRCRDGHKIGPLMADDGTAAAALFDALAATVPGEKVVLDPPGTNEPAVRLAEERGLEPVFETARMYRGAPPELEIQRVFGITTFELG
ncbi:GNAT family N-acetyltransferase [Geminicoccus roseus]|uniref:GNAT family N-acetyltransferase n=1 Tax=Geminicoccus roseus TaxID=404900 RepID=UPI000413929B|nr:GNAT family N-acetyltransferase [Geminicoccus roseus]